MRCKFHDAPSRLIETTERGEMEEKKHGGWKVGKNEHGGLKADTQ